MTTDSTLFDTLTAVQQQVLQALVAGQSISAAAKAAGIHRSTIHIWNQKHPGFTRALLAARHHRAECLIDELGDLASLALDTFRQILSDEQAPASVRLKAAMEIVKLVEAQRPTVLETTIAEVQFDRLDPTSNSTNSPKPLSGPPDRLKTWGAMLPAPAEVPSNTSAVAAIPSAEPVPLEKTNIEKRTRRSHSKQCV